jgi:hypothetical protein
MLPAPYNLPTGYRGDTYGPIVFYFNDISGHAIPLDGVSSSVQVKNKITKCTAMEWSTANSGIFISGNQVTLNPMDSASMEVPADTYDYDFQINSSGIVKTYLRGDFVILPDVSS